MASGEKKLKIALTGAEGQVGSAIIEKLGNKYDFIKIGRNIKPASDSIRVELSNPGEIKGIFNGCDIVIHAAADKRVEAQWPNILPDNIIALYNVYEECVRAGVRRIIFASSNHVQHGHTIRTTPETLNSEFYKTGKLLKLSDPVNPDSLYGVSKVFGEVLGDFYAREHGLEFVGLRIGWTIKEDDPSIMKGTSAEDYMRAMFISRRDCAQLFDKAISVNMKKGESILAYGISNNDRKVFDLEETKKALGFNPEDNSEKYFR